MLFTLEMSYHVVRLHKAIQTFIKLFKTRLTLKKPFDWTTSLNNQQYWISPKQQCRCVLSMNDVQLNLLLSCYGLFRDLFLWFLVRKKLHFSRLDYVRSKNYY